MLLLILTNFLILIDAGISVEPYSLIYLNGLFLLIFTIFFIWRYKKETSYYKSLLGLFRDLDDDWFESITPPHGRFANTTVYTLLQTIHEYEQNKRRDDYYSQQMDHDDLASWVHEMKTPLTAMKITIDAHPSNELAQRLHSNWLKLHLLLDRQLYISRLDTVDFNKSRNLVRPKNLLDIGGKIIYKGDLKRMNVWYKTWDIEEIKIRELNTIYE